MMRKSQLCCALFHKSIRTASVPRLANATAFQLLRAATNPLDTGANREILKFLWPLKSTTRVIAANLQKQNQNENDETHNSKPWLPLLQRPASRVVRRAPSARRAQCRVLPRCPPSPKTRRQTLEAPPRNPQRQTWRQCFGTRCDCHVRKHNGLSLHKRHTKPKHMTPNLSTQQRQTQFAPESSSD
jgi:hypothetical protein